MSTLGSYSSEMVSQDLVTQTKMKTAVPTHTVCASKVYITPCLHVRHQCQSRSRIIASSSSEYPSSASSTPAAAAAAQPAYPGSQNGVPPSATATNAGPSIVQRIKEYFVGSQTEKKKLAALGAGAFLSYGLISNVTYGACVIIAWISFVKATGTTPLAAGQWKPFLAFYAGLWTIQNFVRPLRFALAVALAPAFERLIAGIANRTGWPKPAAFTLCLVCMAIGNITCLVAAIWAFGGFPDGIPFISYNPAKTA